METKTRKIGPPRFIAAVVEGLIPATCRATVAGDWFEAYVSLSQYIFKAARAIPVIVADQVRRTFDLTFVAGEACVLYISFAGAPLLPLVIVIAAVLSVLILRDAYLDPSSRSRQEAATHAIVASTFIFLTQIFLGIAGPSLALPYGMMIRGTAISLMMMSAWRLVIYLKRQPRDGLVGPDAARRDGLQSYTATWRINILWVIACIVLIFTNQEAVPAVRQGRDLLLVLIPLVVLAMAQRLQVNALDSTARLSGPLHLSRDPQKKQLSLKRDMLWTRMSDDSRVPCRAWLEVVFFVLLALPLCSALWRWWSGDPAAALVHWPLVWANLGALLSLSVLWIYIRKLNQKTARSLQEEIDARNTEQKK